MKHTSTPESTKVWINARAPITSHPPYVCGPWTFHCDSAGAPPATARRRVAVAFPGVAGWRYADAPGAPGSRRRRPFGAGALLVGGPGLGDRRRAAHRGGRVAAWLQLSRSGGAAAGLRAGARAEDGQEPGAYRPGQLVGRRPGGPGEPLAHPGRHAG